MFQCVIANTIDTSKLTFWGGGGGGGGGYMLDTYLHVDELFLCNELLG